MISLRRIRHVFALLLLIAAASLLFQRRFLASLLSFAETGTKKTKTEITSSSFQFNSTSRDTSIKPVAPKGVVKQPQRPTKVILLWEAPQYFHLSEVGNPQHCGFCKIDKNRSKLGDEDTDAIVINVLSDAAFDPPIEKKRRPDQLYVFGSGESPGRTQFYQNQKINLTRYPDHYFNATMSYKLDSTFWSPASKGNLISRVKSRWKGVESDVEKLLASKTRTAVWMVSNCKSGSNAKNRLKLSEELIANGLELDRFGKCFNSYPSNFGKVGRTSKDFFRFVSTYKFYLAFENSLHCRDYITEKFHDNSLAAGAVPVVYGATREDYVKVAPPHSYIHVEDFNTTKDLVDYLNYLDKNETAYAEYHVWRNTMKEEDSHLCGKTLWYCALCRTLYGIALDDPRSFAEIYGENGERYSPSMGLKFKQTILSMDDWWHKSESSECLDW